MQAPGAPEEDRSGGIEYGGWLAEYGDEIAPVTIGRAAPARPTHACARSRPSSRKSARAAA
jgi:hypothetical protein